MKDIQTLKNLLTFLKPYETYSLQETSPGVYKLDNVLTLNLANIDFGSFGRRYITINLNDTSISYEVSGYGTAKFEGNANWSDHVNDIISQLTKRARSQIDYNIRSEDNERMRKSRDCRTNRKLMSLIEAT